jgi:hypothetical protein
LLRAAMRSAAAGRRAARKREIHRALMSFLDIIGVFRSARMETRAPPKEARSFR